MDKMLGKLNSRVSPAALVIAILVAVLNFAFWTWLNRPSRPVDWASDKVHGFAYSGFQRHQTPLNEEFPSEDDIDRDLTLLSKYTHRIRTYSSAENAATARIAYQHGLEVTAGAWLDGNLEHNDLELRALAQTAHENSNIDRAVVGNEVLLRGDLSPEQLIGYLKQARRELNIPVSTAEPWHLWLKYPELARNVDYITVHLLPYWEGIPVEDAVDNVIKRYRQVQRAYPSKHIVIGEVGWPSNGEHIDDAEASINAQARFVREFLARTRDMKLDYYFMEAFDQPWKINSEGWTGPYWGIFNAFRKPKFALRGPVVEDPAWRQKGFAASLFALWPMLWFAHKFRRLRTTGKVLFCVLIQSASALAVWLVTVPLSFYLNPVDIVMMLVLLPALAMMLLVLLTNGFEFVEVLWHRGWRRAFAPSTESPAASRGPFVSIHLPCCNEPPEMVILTLDSLAQLEYGNFEVLVIDNNTKNPEIWQPVREHVARLGSRFRFFHLSDWPGFKAGALNFALDQTDPRADIVGVVDADYVVDPAWLKSLIAHFEDSRVAVVQSPQAHRDFERTAFQRMCNWEFEGFFRIGMHHRNERNAIIQHGTMTLIRKGALASTGGWSEWCICEDAELGLRLMRAGYETRYVDAVFGRGLTPADFKAFKAQRFRWAFGAMQILKKRWGWLVGPGSLSLGQRYHFLTGWASWFADALHLVFSVSALAWTVGMLAAPSEFSLPLDLFMIPILGFFVCKMLFGPVLYRARVDCGWRDVLGASLASMGLSHAIACGVIQGLTRKRGVFLRTAKGEGSGGGWRFWRAALQVVREETLIGCALVMGAAATLWHFGLDHREATLWCAILLTQSLPYFAAFACALISARQAHARRAAPAPLPAPRAFGPSTAAAPASLPAGATPHASPATRRDPVH